MPPESRAWPSTESGTPIRGSPYCRRLAVGHAVPPLTRHIEDVAFGTRCHARIVGERDRRADGAAARVVGLLISRAGLVPFSARGWIASVRSAARLRRMPGRRALRFGQTPMRGLPVPPVQLGRRLHRFRSPLPSQQPRVQSVFGRFGVRRGRALLQERLQAVACPDRSSGVFAFGPRAGRWVAILTTLASKRLGSWPCRSTSSRIVTTKWATRDGQSKNHGR
jgi:hypothetical protein